MTPGVKSRMKMQLEQRLQAILQLHLSDQQLEVWEYILRSIDEYSHEQNELLLPEVSALLFNYDNDLNQCWPRSSIHVHVASQWVKHKWQTDCSPWWWISSLCYQDVAEWGVNPGTFKTIFFFHGIQRLIYQLSLSVMVMFSRSAVQRGGYRRW